MIPGPLSVCSTESSEEDVFKHHEPLSSPDYASPIQSFRLSPTYSGAGTRNGPEQRSGTKESQKMLKSSSNNTRVDGRKNLTGPLAAAHRAATSEGSDGDYKGFASNHHPNIHNRKIEKRLRQGSTENSTSEEESYFSDSKDTTSLSSNIDYQIRVDEKREDEANNYDEGGSYRNATHASNKTEKDDWDSEDDVRYSEGYHHDRKEGVSSSLNKLKEPKTMPPSTQENGGRDHHKENKSSQPIRGATKGEAIGLKTQVLRTSLIPSCEKKLLQFIKSPLYAPGRNTVLRCFVERRRIGVNALTPEYCLFVDFGDGNERLLLAARKILKSKTAHYTICADRKDLYTRYGAVVFILC